MFVAANISWRTDHPFATSRYQEASYVISKCELLNNLIALGGVLKKNRTNRLYID